MAPWLKSQDLRLAVKNLSADDQQFVDLAAGVGCGKVEDLCGPIEITTITNEVHQSRSSSICLKYRATSLVSLATDSGSSFTVGDWAIDGQVLRRKSGLAVTDTLVVSYTSGYFSEPDQAPTWARSAAIQIGQQFLRTLRRFGQSSEGPVGFLVPIAAMELMDDYLLAPGDFE